MHRRLVLTGLLAAGLFPQGALAAQPWKLSLVGDAFDGSHWLSGVRVQLAPGWKTYWRMPGDSGIPPQFEWPAETAVEVFYPTPSRFQDASGETIGYHDDVVFPVRVPVNAASTLQLTLDLFLGVCREVCIPAQGQAKLTLSQAMRDPAGSKLAAAWMDKVPTAGNIVTGAELSQSGEGIELLVSLSEPVDDIFVEADGGAYFRKPVFSGSQARLAVSTAKNIADFAGTSIRLTYVRGGKGLEQTVRLA